MNVSMMDSYNLSWKLAHVLHNLTPPTSNKTDPILKTFEQERLNVARQLIDFDSKFSSMFSGQIADQDPSVKGLTHDEFVTVFRGGSGFTSGCGIEYESSVLVKRMEPLKDGPVIRHDPLSGTLCPGRRLLNVDVRRYADANPRNLQDGKCS
jgi:phenol 2-monooxygenase